MSVNWGLIRIDESTNVDTDDCFDAEPCHPSEIDLVLLGKKDGPAIKLVESIPDEPMKREGFSDMRLVSFQAIQRCAKQLWKVENIPAVSAQEYVRTCSLNIFEGAEEESLDIATERAQQFREFIFLAASRRWKLRFWCG